MIIKKSLSIQIYLFLMLITGCATGIKGTPNEVTTQTVSPRAGYGVVFGRICDGNGLWFRSKDHSKSEYLHTGGKTAFTLQLPEGSYQLTHVGSNVGVMVADQPLEFTVTAEAVEYVGSLLPGWNAGYVRFPGACNSEEDKVIRTLRFSNQGVFGTGKPIWTLYLANDFPSALRDVKQAFPLLDTSRSTENLMH